MLLIGGGVAWQGAKGPLTADKADDYNKAFE